MEYYIFRSIEGEEFKILILREGMDVVHSRFGEGRVLCYSDTLATVEFKNGNQKEKKTLLRKYAKLKPKD